MNIVDQQTEFFGHYLGDNRVRPLPHIGGAGEYVDLAVIIHFDNGPASVRLVDSGTATDMNQRSHTNPFSLLVLCIPREGFFD